MTVTYPIVTLGEGEELDPDWVADVTESANDHETRLGTLESPDWIDYTCTWSASTTPPTLNNTTRYNRYYYVNRKQITVVCRFEMGATSTEGVGTYTFSLPVAAVNTTGKGATGTWIMNDSGAAIRTGVAIIETTTTTLKLFTGTSPSAQLGDTVLTGTFATSWLQFTITYEIA